MNAALLRTVLLCHFQVTVVIRLQTEKKDRVLCDPPNEVLSAYAKCGQEKTRQIGGITVPSATHMPLTVVSPIVLCNYLAGEPQRSADHNLALGHAASRIIIKHKKKIEATLSSLRSFIRHESDSRMCLYHFVKPKLNLSR